MRVQLPGRGIEQMEVTVPEEATRLGQRGRGADALRRGDRIRSTALAARYAQRLNVIWMRVPRVPLVPLIVIVAVVFGPQIARTMIDGHTDVRHALHLRIGIDRSQRKPVIFVVVQMQLLPPNRDLAHRLVLLQVAVARPHVQGEIAKLPRHLELEQLVEERTQRTLLHRAINLLLVQGDRAIDVALPRRIAIRTIVAAQQVLGITWRGRRGGRLKFGNHLRGLS